MQKKSIYLNDLGIINSLGEGKEEVLKKLLIGKADHFTNKKIEDTEYPVGICNSVYTDPLYLKDKNRMNVLLSRACQEIRETTNLMIEKFGKKRIGVILGSTDNGSEQSLFALNEFLNSGSYPESYELEQQQAHYPSDFVRDFFGLESISSSISTACTSSGSAIILAKKLLNANILDCVIVGGADIVSESVLKGFISLEAVDRKKTIPFSVNRKGINLGEGAALFVMSKEPLGDNGIILAGTGETSDAHHMTAPDPSGKGAMEAMNRAIIESGMNEVDYINLHGTGTILNDNMEALATKAIFPHNPLLSSTKPMVGHTLGAASAVELGFCWLVLSDLNREKRLPSHLWDGKSSNETANMNFVNKKSTINKLECCMSNSYAFGGCNVSIIIKREKI